MTTSLEKVLDLSDGSVLSSAGIAPADLVRASHTFTQQIGEAAHERGVRGIRSPSATGVDDVLALFPENLGAATLEVEFAEVSEWPEDVPS